MKRSWGSSGKFYVMINIFQSAPHANGNVGISSVLEVGIDTLKIYNYQDL